jgi:hypothetical protein
MLTRIVYMDFLCLYYQWEQVSTFFGRIMVRSFMYVQVQYFECCFTD